MFTQSHRGLDLKSIWKDGLGERTLTSDLVSPSHALLQAELRQDRALDKRMCDLREYGRGGEYRNPGLIAPNDLLYH